MSAKLQCLTFACLAIPLFASNVSSLPMALLDDATDVDADIEAMTSLELIANMENVFARSQEVHTSSMDALMQKMSARQALAVLEAHPMATKSLVEVAEAAVHSTQGSLRASKVSQPKGYSGVAKARKMLNEMIGESMEKYDLEIAKCTNYYSKQCGLMEGCRGEIAAANYKAANSRQHILAAQTQVDISKVALPKLTLELHQHKLKCEHEIGQLKNRIQVVMGDISIMTMILKMTDCEASLVAMETLGLLHCSDSCSKETFVTFQDKNLRDSVAKLKSSNVQQLLKDNFADLVDGGEPTVEFLQGEVTPIQNKTKKNMPPVPRTEVPANPCTDPAAGGPSAATKRAAKCSINKMPQCYKLQERFMLIQSGIMDDRDNLKDSLEMLENHCEELRQTLESDISDEETMLKEEGTKLAEATTEESNAGEKARLVAKQHEELALDLKKMMKSCNTNYVNFETEQCGLKKIRGELAKIAGGPTGAVPFYQDCKLSKWEPGECTKECGGGTRVLSRKIMTQPDKGAKCLPLESTRRCNDIPCPVNCKLEPWGGWSRCSSECGGGVTQRLRDIKVQMKHNGEPCGETSEAKACNVQACEKDCELGEWTKWSRCSKDCDGGTAKRQKFVKHKALGEGKCQDQWAPERLEYKKCNQQACVKNGTDTLKCKGALDVVLVLDGSGSIGKKGWEGTKKFAKMFIDAFDDKEANAEIAVLLYSGPRTWGGVGKCMGETPSKTKVDLDKTCKIRWIQHFDKDLTKAKEGIDKAVWPKGGTLTSLALGAVANELTLGRKDAKTAVVVVTDGRPLSFGRTFMAARSLRKSARLLFVPVTEFAPLKSIKTWASRRWQENVVKVDNFDTLSKVDTVDHLIADLCPDVDDNKGTRPGPQ